MNCFHSINYGFLLVFTSAERHSKCVQNQVMHKGKRRPDNDG